MPCRSWLSIRSCAEKINDRLHDEFAIYVLPINYPSPFHSAADIAHLVEALAMIWAELDLRRAA